MARKPARGRFTPKNASKYIGGNINDITYRSSWELTMMNYFDQHPMIIGWMSESVPSNHYHKGLSGIPYQNPFTGRWTFYVPDFFVVYNGKNGKPHAEIIEVKPSTEVPGFRGRASKLQEGRQIINHAKFQAALKYCNKYGFGFRICTEKDMFSFTPPSQKK